MKNLKQTIFFVFVTFQIISSAPFAFTPHGYFMIKAVDTATGRGIPMVEFKTINHIAYLTDSNGIIAFYEPELMDMDVYFYVNGQGYEYPRDIFGYQGLALRPTAGDSVIINLNRTNIAERLYRVTGAGIYRDSFILGLSVPIKKPLLNGKVLGQDSNLSTIYKNKIFWIWGDTFKPSYPLGNFSISAATSELPSRGGLNPNLGVNLGYFEDSQGFSKKMIEIPGPGFVWFDWLMVLPDENGQEKLVAKYARVKPTFENHERGLAIYNDQDERFEKYKTIDSWIPYYHVNHHPFLAESDGQKYYYLTSEFNFSRVKPILKDVADPESYESFTCLDQGQKFNKSNPLVERNRAGKLVWDWKINTDPIGIVEQQVLIDSGIISEEEQWVNLQDFYTGEKKIDGRNSICWNNYRNKWIMIAGKKVGEIWYAEADTPLGPWVFAKRIVKHDKFFYNPVHHPFFDQDGGRLIYFEGTYTNSFLPEKNLTPRYEYNQIMYRLSLNDSRLFMPEPVYRVQSDQYTNEYRFGYSISTNKKIERIKEVSFFAFPPRRHYPNLIPVYTSGNKLSTKTDDESEILFYALPFSDNENIMGRWEISLTDNVFFTKKLRIQILSENNATTTSIEENGLILIESVWNENKYTLSFSHFNDVYNLCGQINSGKLSGKWLTSDSTKNGTWEGVCIDYTWQTGYSPLVAPLYQFTKYDSTDHFYSTSELVADKSFRRSEKPICRVWKNPGSNLIFDFKTEPVIIDYK